MKNISEISTSTLKVITKLVANSNLGQLKDAIETELGGCSDTTKQAVYLEVISIATNSINKN